jgi:lactate permease
MLGAMISMICLAVFLAIWKPKTVMLDASGAGVTVPRAQAAQTHHGHSRDLVIKAWTPWVILTVVLFLWGLPVVKAFLNMKGITYWEWQIPGLHNLVQRVEPAVAAPRVEPAIWKWGVISATGTGILIAAVVAGLRDGLQGQGHVQNLDRDLRHHEILVVDDPGDAGARLHHAIRWHGRNLGLAFANTGWLYPFFGTMIGWIGVALTWNGCGLQCIVREPAGDHGK